MNILVCVKQVPDTGPQVSHRVPSGKTQPFHMNRNDVYAVAEALLIKGKNPSVRVDAITAGPPESSAVLRMALEMGADNGIHIILDEDSCSDSSCVSSSICNYISENTYDIIITGMLSEDSMQGEMGGILAGKLNMPYAFSLIRMELDFDRRVVHVDSEIDGGSRIKYTVKLPLVVSVQTGINTPEYPTLTNKLRAKKQKLINIYPDAGSLILNSKKRISLKKKEKSSNGIVMEGTREEISEKLLQIIYEKRLLR